MKKEKEIKLEATGWKIGGIAEFLALSPEEAEYIENRTNDRLKGSGNAADDECSGESMPEGMN
ncbi:hypothetical protein G9409_05485 [Chlorobium sp. BLA1]|uniref:hypothetical protein n=1 Tax=Candidatus Chlorobium masyuteum TaxID=2716876 RepID=UPI00141FE14C|nr:hypothetical protein [Candidatus Chlorobium masyuteum]NHQ60044.1 hypothetical protein [Candidatus Chlorobium masyuteum]